MQEGKTPTYLRTHRLKGKFLTFLLDEEDRALRERAESSRIGRAAKALVKQGPFRVTLVALRKGAFLDPHQVAAPVSLQALRGCLQLNTAAGDVELPPGGLVTFEAGVTHSATALDDCALLITVAMQ